MHDANIQSCLNTVLIGKPGDEEYERSLDELVEGLTDPRYEFNIQEQKFKRKTIAYMIKSHGFSQRIRGGLYSIHPYEVAREILKGPDYVKNGDYTGLNDIELICSALLHDNPEENIENELNRYLNSRLGFVRKIPIINKNAKSFLKKTKNYRLNVNIFHNNEIKKLNVTKKQITKQSEKKINRYIG